MFFIFKSKHINKYLLNISNISRDQNIIGMVCNFGVGLHIKDDLSSDSSSGAINNLANASGMSAAGYSAMAVNMNIIDNRPPPPPHTNMHHMPGNCLESHFNFYHTQC